MSRGARRGVVLAGLALVAVTGVGYARNAALHFDEFYFLDAARQLATDGRYATTINGGAVAFDPMLSTGPTVILPIAAVFRLAGDSYLVARLVMVAVLVATLAAFVRAGTVLYDRDTGLVAGLLFLAVPALWFHSLHVLGEVPALLGFLLGLSTLAGGAPERPWRRAALAGCALGLAALTKTIFALGLVAVVAVAAWRALAGDRRTAARLALAVAAGAGILSAWEAVQAMVLGPEEFREAKRAFGSVFATESGLGTMVRAWPDQGLHPVARTVVRNLGILEEQARLAPWQLGPILLAGLYAAGRDVYRRPAAPAPAILLATLVAYHGWWFLAPHAPWYRLVFPAYALLALPLAALTVGCVRRLRVPTPGRVAAATVCLAYVAVTLLRLPFHAEVRRHPLFDRSELTEQRAFLEAVRAVVPPAARIGYWGWWRGPELSFHLPNGFYDISQPEIRPGFEPRADYLVMTPLERQLDPSAVERQQAHCGAVLARVGEYVLCRFHDADSSRRMAAIGPGEPPDPPDLTPGEPAVVAWQRHAP